MSFIAEASWTATTRAPDTDRNKRAGGRQNLDGLDGPCWVSRCVGVSNVGRVGRQGELLSQLLDVLAQSALKLLDKNHRLPFITTGDDFLGQPADSAFG